MSLIEYLALFSSVVVGGGLAFLINKNEGQFLQLLLSFSGAYILGITFLHLIPEAYEISGQEAGKYALLGFIIQLSLEQLSKGVEHGHIHALHQPKKSVVFTVMIGLCVHAFIEGMPLSGYEDLHNHTHGHHHHGHDHGTGGMNNLLFGIILHKLPAAFALVLLLLASKFKNSFIILCLSIFAMMSPLGALLAEFLHFTPAQTAIALSVVIGSFFHIATTIIFETGSDHKVPIPKLLAIIVGLFISFVSTNSLF